MICLWNISSALSPSTWPLFWGVFCLRAFAPVSLCWNHSSLSLVTWLTSCFSLKVTSSKTFSLTFPSKYGLFVKFAQRSWLISFWVIIIVCNYVLKSVSSQTVKFMGLETMFVLSSALAPHNRLRILIRTVPLNSYLLNESVDEWVSAAVVEGKRLWHCNKEMWILDPILPFRSSV